MGPRRIEGRRTASAHAGLSRRIALTALYCCVRARIPAEDALRTAAAAQQLCRPCSAGYLRKAKSEARAVVEAIIPALPTLDPDLGSEALLASLAAHLDSTCFGELARRRAEDFGGLRGGRRARPTAQGSA